MGHWRKAGWFECTVILKCNKGESPFKGPLFYQPTQCTVPTGGLINPLYIWQDTPTCDVTTKSMFNQVLKQGLINNLVNSKCVWPRGQMVLWCPMFSLCNDSNRSRWGRRSKMLLVHTSAVGLTLMVDMHAGWIWRVKGRSKKKRTESRLTTSHRKRQNNKNWIKRLFQQRPLQLWTHYTK